MSNSKLFLNVHEVAENPSSAEKISLVSGNYEYYHYLCDGFDDRGWGCGYRTLQTVCSWMNQNHRDLQKVPTIREVQEILVQMQDKPSSFIGSRQWIGSFEVCLILDNLYDVNISFLKQVCLILDNLYDVPCKILHVNKGDELQTLTESLKNHFVKFGSPVMMGGDVDCSSKGVMGVCEDKGEVSLLIVDPHYVGRCHSREYLYKEGWVKWQPLNEFLSSSFYNMCLPQVKAKASI